MATRIERLELDRIGEMATYQMRANVGLILLKREKGNPESLGLVQEGVAFCRGYLRDIKVLSGEEEMEIGSYNPREVLADDLIEKIENDPEERQELEQKVGQIANQLQRIVDAKGQGIFNVGNLVSNLRELGNDYRREHAARVGDLMYGPRLYPRKLQCNLPS